MSEAMVSAIIAGLVTVLGGGATVALIQMVAARRKTGAEATKINTETTLSEFDALKAELWEQLRDERARVDRLQTEVSDLQQRYRDLWDYAAMLRLTVPPPPPEWPVSLSARSATSAN